MGRHLPQLALPLIRPQGAAASSLTELAKGRRRCCHRCCCWSCRRRDCCSCPRSCAATFAAAAAAAAADTDATLASYDCTGWAAYHRRDPFAGGRPRTHPGSDRVAHALHRSAGGWNKGMHASWRRGCAVWLGLGTREVPVPLQSNVRPAVERVVPPRLTAAADGARHPLCGPLHRSGQRPRPGGLAGHYRTGALAHGLSAHRQTKRTVASAHGAEKVCERATCRRCNQLLSCPAPALVSATAAGTVQFQAQRAAGAPGVPHPGKGSVAASQQLLHSSNVWGDGAHVSGHAILPLPWRPALARVACISPTARLPWQVYFHQ